MSDHKMCVVIRITTSEADFKIELTIDKSNFHQDVFVSLHQELNIQIVQNNRTCWCEFN